MTCWRRSTASVFLDLGPLKDATLVASSVAAALGLVVHHADPTDSIIAFLRDRRLLLVLDSCEHVIDVVAALAENIHQRAPNVSILATSRESLLVQGEQIFDLSRCKRRLRDGAERQRGAELSRGTAIHGAGQAAGHRADLTDDDANVLAEICGKLDGIALAIELAAVRVGVHGLREVAALLDGRLKLEWRGRRTAPPRHQTLGATLDWSYGLIDEGERTALRRLAIFAGQFTLQGALAVAGDEHTPADQVVDALGQLVAKSLVSARPEGGSTRYRLLDTTRAYAMQKLVDCGEREHNRRRHAGYVQQVLETTMAEASGGGQAPRAQERASLLADARAALTWVYAMMTARTCACRWPALAPDCLSSSIC